MFELTFGGVASTPRWSMQVAPNRTIDLEQTTTRTAGRYRAFADAAAKLPEIVAEFSKLNNQLFDELAPLMVELMGAKQFVIDVLKARGFDVQEVSQTYVSFTHPNHSRLFGAFQDGQFYWANKNQVQMQETGIRTFGSELFFKTTEDDFDVKFLTAINIAPAMTNSTEGA